jgi:hypothetical protein
MKPNEKEKRHLLGNECNEATIDEVLVNESIVPERKTLEPRKVVVESLIIRDAPAGNLFRFVTKDQIVLVHPESKTIDSHVWNKVTTPANEIGWAMTEYTAPIENFKKVEVTGDESAV